MENLIRISVIFRVRSAKAVKITDLDLLKRLGVIVAIFSVFLVIRTLVAPPYVIVGRTADDLKAFLCRTDWWDHSFTTMEVLFLVWGIRLCIVVRKAPSEFNESRFISMAIYNEFLLSVFLNVSMLFLQSPANPDLLYIIFFCHTQLTVTLLLCLIFGSKAYMVFKGHGKAEEGSSAIPKPQAAKFLAKPRSGNSQCVPSTNSSTAGAQEYSRLTEQDVQEEFQRLYTQLVQLKEKNMRLGNRHLAAKITAMQEAAQRQEDDHAAEEAEDDSVKLNNVLAVAVGKVQEECASAPQESGSSHRSGVANLGSTMSEADRGSISPNSATPADESGVRMVEMSSSTCTKNGDGSVSDSSGDSRKKRGKSSGAKRRSKSREGHRRHGEDSVGQLKAVTEDGEERETPSLASPKTPARTATHSQSSSEGASPSGNNRNLKSGHARTHAIIINLDDKNRFTEEVTV